MPFYVYILGCSDGTYYTGHTDNLDQRMAQHGDGRGSRYTAKRRPLKLLWATDCQTREEAWELEQRLHGWSRAKKEALMGGGLRSAARSFPVQERPPSSEPASSDNDAFRRSVEGDRSRFDRLNVSARGIWRTK